MTHLPLLDDLHRHLRTERLGRPARGYQETGSTNRQAMTWTREGAPEGSLVVAEHQTAGCGRLGRSWNDASGRNLLFSVVLRPDLPAEGLSLITLAAGVAVTDAIAACLPHQPAIKWPNDVLVGGRKCCGMLLESSSKGTSPGPVVLGVGLNVNQEVFPDELAGRATSLLLEGGRPVSRAPLLADLLRQLEKRYDALRCDEGASVREAYEARLAGCGDELTVRTADGSAEAGGTLHGVSETGALVLETASGRRTFHAGEVTVVADGE
ncbi:MAG: biotin--[acetyl-CoA-carboxylase] ligase [Bacteroidetes bacterium QS_8_64_10]|nr:MAG: biotin--[acetyl-CoA-carboxylase] ligase [Bacteroidetes bacterium QS_8_64_10]